MDPNEAFLVKAFVKGLHDSSFSESLYRFPPKTLIEIRQKSVFEIETEDTMKHKRTGDKRLTTISKIDKEVKPFR